MGIIENENQKQELTATYVVSSFFSKQLNIKDLEYDTARSYSIAFSTQFHNFAAVWSQLNFCR